MHLAIKRSFQMATFPMEQGFDPTLVTVSAQPTSSDALARMPVSLLRPNHPWCWQGLGRRFVCS
jgi:hypothetical protein